MMSDNSESGVLTPAQKKYVKKGDQFIQDNNYSESYADVLKSRIRERFYQAISDLDLLLENKERWMSATTEPLDRQNQKLQQAIKEVRTDLMRQFLYDITSSDENNIEVYGLMLQNEVVTPPEVDTEASYSAEVIELAKKLQTKFDIQGDLIRSGTSLGPVGSIIETLLPHVNRSIDKERFQDQQNKALRFTLLDKSGNPVERFPLAVENDSISLTMVDHTNSELEWYGDVVLQQESGLKLLDPEDSMSPDRARYQYKQLTVFPKENNSRKIAWLFCSALLDSLSTTELAVNEWRGRG